MQVELAHFLKNQYFDKYGSVLGAHKKVSVFWFAQMFL